MGQLVVVSVAEVGEALVARVAETAAGWALGVEVAVMDEAAAAVMVAGCGTAHQRRSNVSTQGEALPKRCEMGSQMGSSPAQARCRHSSRTTSRCAHCLGHMCADPCSSCSRPHRPGRADGTRRWPRDDATAHHSRTQCPTDRHGRSRRVLGWARCQPQDAHCPRTTVRREAMAAEAERLGRAVVVTGVVADVEMEC